MLIKKAEADPWKVIVTIIIVLVCTLFILFFFTDTFSSTSSNLKFECWELNIPGRCFCENQADCATEQGRDKCAKELREKCYD